MLNQLKQNLPGKVIALIFFCALLFVVVYKTLHVPITHDEKASSVYYPEFTVWQIMMYPDCWPSNHILNTLCIKLDEYIFGIEPWSVRLHSILSFILFYAVLWFIAERYFNKWWALFCLPFFVMFCNPFLLDFYGLARGYGMSNALMACSVYCLLLFSGSFKWRWHYLSVAFAMLAAYANFTLLIYWVALHGILVVLILSNTITEKKQLKEIWPHAVATALIAIAFLALCYEPLYKMQSTNQFVYWSKDGFFKDTLLDQVDKFRYQRRYFGIPSEYAAFAVLAIFWLTGGYVFYKLIKERAKALLNPLVAVFILVLLMYMVNMAQAILLGTPYLTTRTALCYYVLFAFVIMFLLRDIFTNLPSFKYFVPVIVFALSVHMGKSVSLKYVLEWWYDANTYTVTSYLKDYMSQHPNVKQVDLNTTWIFNPSFEFYHITGKTPWLNITEYHKEIDTASTTLFYYATHDDAWQLKNYSSVLDFPNSGSVLMIYTPSFDSTKTRHVY